MKQCEIKLDNATHKFVKGELGLNCYYQICSLYDICMNTKGKGICTMFFLPNNGHFEIKE